MEPRDTSQIKDATSTSSTNADEELVENEPYLGPAWAVAMLILYLLKEAFPAETYSLLWWFQTYIIGLVIAITLFTLIKRHQFYRSESAGGENESASS